MKRAEPKSLPCPCGSGRALDACCGPYLNGAALPPDAETLMRSRYTAYALHNKDYLLATWHPATRPDKLDLTEPPVPKWLGLEVRHHRPADTDHATVEFVARYKIGGRACRLQERSRFERIAGRWYYLDGEIEAEA